jgi:hypothetical protein
MTAIIVIVAIILFVGLYAFAVRENSKPQPKSSWKIPAETKTNVTTTNE